MDATQTFIKIHRVAPGEAEDFEFDFDTKTDDLFCELVPDLEAWGEIGWMTLEDYEYNLQQETMHLTLNTKRAAPIDWLQHASASTPYFQNKLITMATIQQDESCVRGVAVMDGEVLQNKYIFEVDPEEVAKYYNDEETEYPLDTLDNHIWDSIGRFTTVCEQFYIEKETENV